VTLSESLLGDDPAAIIEALTAAARNGASPADLGRALAYAAALRVARFGTANEHSDWPEWLAEEPADPARLKLLLAPYPAEEMTCWQRQHPGRQRQE
jgi:hypothetical protein